MIIRCKRCIVSAKSGTSFDLDTRIKIGITLQSYQQGIALEELGSNTRYKAGQQPDKANGPADSVVSTDTLPVEYKIQGEGLAEDKSRE